jgi:hypothetical protein
MSDRDCSNDQQRTIECTGRRNLASEFDAAPIDPRAFGLLKVAYGVNETLELLSIGRTSLYAVVKRGDLTPVKFGKKTLFYAIDLAVFLARLKASGSTPDKPCRQPNG